MRNSVPKLVNAIRPSLNDIAVWTGKSRALANVWRDGKFQPKDPVDILASGRPSAGADRVAYSRDP